MGDIRFLPVGAQNAQIAQATGLGAHPTLPETTMERRSNLKPFAWTSIMMKLVAIVLKAGIKATRSTRCVVSALTPRSAVAGVDTSFNVAAFSQPAHQAMALG